jgi:hypothetical protein
MFLSNIKEQTCVPLRHAPALYQTRVEESDTIKHFVTAGKVLLYRLFGRFGLAAILLPDRVVHLVVVLCKDGPMKSRYQMLEVGLEPV